MKSVGRRDLLKVLGASPLATAVGNDAVVPGHRAALTNVSSDSEGDVLASTFGVRADGQTDDRGALQAAVDYTLSRPNCGRLILPAGELRLEGDVIIRQTRVGRADRHQIVIEGGGAGENGTWLHFLSGSLIVASSNHVLRDFRVTSRTGDGVVIRPEGAGTKSPSRGMMENIRSEYCARSGVTIEDCWIYSLINCYARFNRHCGFEGRAGRRMGIACNALTIVGGEFQGNGTRNSSKRGSGAGIVTGRCVQFSVTGGAIEGNLGDGVLLSQQLRGLSMNSVYFEKNGSHSSNCDITTDHFVNGNHDAVNFPNSVLLINCNFTPQDTGGPPQSRAIDLVNVKDLRVINPQFFAQTKPVLYAEEPIRIRETQPGRCTGWIEGGYFSSVSYAQDMVRNEAARFGFPRVHRFNPGSHSGQVVTWTPIYCIPLPDDAATRVDIVVLTRLGPAETSAQISCGGRFGPTTGNWSMRSEAIHYRSDGKPSVFRRRVGRKIGTPPPNFVEIQIGLSAAEAAPSARLMSVEVTSYEARIT